MAGGEITARSVLEIVLRGQAKTNKELSMINKEISLLSKNAGTADASLKKMSGSTQNLNKHLKTTGERGVFGSKGLIDLVKSGMIMSIGWQAINGLLTGTITIFQQMAMGGVELESSLISLEAVATSTGRSYAGILNLMSTETDAFMTKTALAPGILRLLSTELDTGQIRQFIQAVKDGSAAMGYQADEQLPLIARGFKQLTANLLDNIGVTIYLTRIRRRASQELGISIDALTEAQIHQALFNEMIEQTTKYTGLYEKQLDTAKGAMARINVEWVKLTENVGNTEAIKNSSNAIADLVSIFNTLILAERSLQREQEGLIESITESGTIFAFYAKVIQAQVIAMAPVIPLTREWWKANKESIGVRAEIESHQESYNALLKEFADIQSKVTSDMGIADKVMKDYAIALNVINLTGEAYTKTMEYLTDQMPEHISAIVEISKEGKKLSELYSLLSAQQLEMGATQLGLEEAIKSDSRAIIEHRKILRDYRKELKSINASLSEFGDKLKSLESKREALNPSAFKETEDILKDVRRELEKTNDEVDKTRENLFKRVEPRLYEEYIRANDEALKKKAELEDQEVTLLDKIRGEISLLEEQVKGTAALEERKKLLTIEIEKESNAIDTLNDNLSTNRQQLEDLKEPMDILKEDLKIITAEIKAANEQWKEFSSGAVKISKTAEAIYNKAFNYDIGSLYPENQIFQSPKTGMNENKMYNDIHKGPTTENTYVDNININGSELTPQQMFSEINRITRLKRAQVTS